MVKIPFMKLSGAGNDFVIIDNRESIIPYEDTDFVEKVCQRRMSVGADGVLLVEDAAGVDFRMRYFNADGGEAETCGNGARCISKFAYINGIVPERMRFETNAGIYESEIIESNVKVRMGELTDIRLNFPLQLNDGVHNICSRTAAYPTLSFLPKTFRARTLLTSAAKHAITTILSLWGQTRTSYTSRMHRRLIFGLTNEALKMKPSLAAPALSRQQWSVLCLAKSFLRSR